MTKRLRMASVILLAASFAAPAFSQSAGDLYKSKCQACHLADGTGNKAMKVASFKAPDVVKATDAQLIASTNNGVPPKMPGYKGKLTDAQISDLVKYIRTLQK